MDLPSNNMYDTFKEEIWKELGPLDPDWFEALSAQTFSHERNVSNQDDLCTNQEGNIKTQFDKPTADSQLFSTPKVFRHCRVVSPDTENEQSFSSEQEKQTLPWPGTQSPYLIETATDGVQSVKYRDIQDQSHGSFNLLHTPLKSPNSYAKHVSECLGAEIHPDISWTSSLNTPPASTLIITNPDESPCPVNVSADKNAVLVQKLFPSLSNASRVGVVSPQTTDVTTVHQGVVCCESLDSSQRSANQNNSVWKQRLPDAIEDGEIRSTVASVLEGAEDVLSIFFTNRSSALRKVKTDRVKRKQVIPKSKHDCSSTDISTTNTAASSEQRASDQKTDRLTSPPPLKAGDTGITQWSPLSLSEIPLSTMDSSCHNSAATEVEHNSRTPGKWQHVFDRGQQKTPHMEVVNTGHFNKKRRKFVYSIETSKLQVHGEDTQSQKMESSLRIPDSGQHMNVTQLEGVPDEADCSGIMNNEIKVQETLAEENIHQDKFQNLDLSQLSRDFAQDFSQMPDPSKLSNIAKDIPRNGFSPSACLLAMKRANKKVRQTNLHHDAVSGSNSRFVSTANHNSLTESTMIDSGFQSTVADITHKTTLSFVLPSSENEAGFKSDIHGTTCFLSTNEGTVKSHLEGNLQEAETNVKLPSAVKESRTVSPVKECELHVEGPSEHPPSSAKGTVNHMKWIVPKGQDHGSLPGKTEVSLPTVLATGFKTSSHKGIHISSANLERAKYLFEETKGEKTHNDQLIRSTHGTKDELDVSHESVKNTINTNPQLSSNKKNVDDSCHLTVSQKADVTELCTLLEEVESQFEFTQFRTAKPNEHCQDNSTCPQKADRELDPDFLMGIDFDDSFNSDAEKHQTITVMHDKEAALSGKASNMRTKSTGLLLSAKFKSKEKFSTKDVSNISECRSRMLSAEPKNPHRDDHTETSKLEDKNPLMPGVGFKTAGGNVLTVSKECVSKAKAMFADLEENVTSDTSTAKQSSGNNAQTQQKWSEANHTGNVLHLKQERRKLVTLDGQVPGHKDGVKHAKMDTLKSQSGFQMASGKEICISAKAMQEADAFFKDCDPTDANASMLVKHTESIESVSGIVSQETNLKCKNVQGMTENGDKILVLADALKEEDCLSNGMQTENTTKHLGKQILVSPSQNVRFQTASGKGVSISSAALKKAKSLLKDCDGIEHICEEQMHSKMPFPGQLSRSHGFLAASGKPVAFSSEALQKAKALFSDISFIAEIPAVSHPRNYNKKQDNAGYKEKILPSTEIIGCSSVNESSNSGGFHTASGKKVSVSNDAMTKTKSLLSEIVTLEGANKQLNEKLDTLPPQSGGFQTASGKGVNISSAALQKAKIFFSDCEGIKDIITTKPTQSKTPVLGQVHGSHGFLAASGNPVAFSSQALQKAKALFSDISFNAEIPAVSDTRNNEHRDALKDTETVHCGFTTAGGAKVSISQKSLLKAKKLLEELNPGSVLKKEKQDVDFDTMNCQDGISPQHRKIIPNVSGCDSKKKQPTQFKQDQSAIRMEALHSDDGEIHNKVFKNALDSSSAGSPSKNQSSMENSSTFYTTSEIIGCSSINKLSNSGGFHTASGKKVSVSNDAMTKANSLLNEIVTLEGTNKQLNEKLETLPPQSGGFQTASGKGVNISTAALQKAKILLSECEGVDNIDKKAMHSKTPVLGQVHGNHRFLAASAKPVAFSSEALQKAKALFSDISFNAEIPAVSDTRNNEHKDGPKDTEMVHCGFTTAGGTKVHVSQKNLWKAKNLLKDLADGECCDSHSYSANPHDMKEAKRTSNSSLTIANDKDIAAKGNAPQVVKASTSLHANEHECEALPNSNERALKNGRFKIGKSTTSGVSHFHENPEEEMLSALEYEMNQTSGSEISDVKKTDSSVLGFQSLNLSGCTDIQQKFLAQEALDCTKALLEDENLSGQTLSMTENMSLFDNQNSSDGSADEHKGKGKRLAEDPGITCQPPLKRRLLEEFDRTVDGPRGSTLHPEKSSPNGVMKDRRVFKYSISLHPNITTPHRTGKTYVETRLLKTTPIKASDVGDSKAAESNMATFIPPFFKTEKTESHKCKAVEDNIRTPSAFIPPFKKLKSIALESSSKPQEEEHKLHHISVMPSNRNSYVPPTKKTQSSTNVTGNKSKEDVKTLALADTTNNKLKNHQNGPVGCDLEDSAAEASCVEDTVSRSQDMFQSLHNIELARDMQDMRIRKKKRQTIRPLPGSFFLTKTSGVSRIQFKAAVNRKPPARCTLKQLYSHGVHQHVYKITSETAESFRFNLQQFIKWEAFVDEGGVQLADGGWLIPCNDGTAGKEEFYRSLCDTPGVDPKLISEEWVFNHYRWIVWKQASMERSFPEIMGSLCLTPEQVLLQLKYRYDVEVDHSRRPALRKIMEKDDTAAKTMVLCACGVVSSGHSPKRYSLGDLRTPNADSKVENPCAVVWLTDGWYSIKAQLDEPLTAMLRKGRLAVGGKLIIHGAQLVGSQDACSPLEAPESLMLKICANSSRPTRWDTKLGFHRDPRPFLLPVSSLYSNGGPVGCVDIIILRSYPIQWMERKPDGGIVFRSVRAEEKEARKYNIHKQQAMEILFAKIQAGFEREEKGNSKPQRKRQTISRQDIASLQDGEELYEAVGDDPAYFEALLSEQQMEALHSHKRFLMEKKQADLQDRYRRALENAEDGEGGCPKRDVTPVWRLCIADSMDQPGSVYQLNLWRPPSDLQSSLKEGSRYRVYNLTTSDSKKPVGSTAVQLTGTKKTQFEDVPVSQEWLSTRFQSRVSTHLMDLQNLEFQPLCGEVDLTGYVIDIMDRQGFSPAFYLADGELNFVKVRCFNSLAQSGLEDVVKPRVLLAVSNLQLRSQSTSPTPLVYSGDLTVFSTNPKEVHLQESLRQLRNQVQGQENFFLTAEDKLSQLISSDGLSTISSPAWQTQTPAPTKDRGPDKTSVMCQQPFRNLGSFTPVNRNPRPPTNCSTEKDPSTLKRRRALDYLSRVPSPPPLSILSSVTSPCVKKTFVPPRRSGTPSTLKTVQTPAHKTLSAAVEDEWVNDEELAMIDTQALLVGKYDDKCNQKNNTN